jgi:hypothetical protein
MSKGTPRRAVRVEDELWDSALGVASERGDNLSEIIRERLREYIKTWGTK